MRFALHLFLHVAVPGALARVAWRERWLRARAVLVATMVVWTTCWPIQSSIQPLQHRHPPPTHTWPATCVWLVLCFPAKTRLVGIGLVIHMLLDGIDCLWMRSCGG